MGMKAFGVRVSCQWLFSFGIEMLPRIVHNFDPSESVTWAWRMEDKIAGSLRKIAGERIGAVHQHGVSLC